MTIRSVRSAVAWVICISCVVLGSVSVAQVIENQYLQTCTLAGCLEGAGLEIRLSDIDQTPPPRLPNVELIVDGKRVHCVGRLAASPDRVSTFCSDKHVIFSISEREGCNPYDHPECLTDVVIVIPGTPKRVYAHLSGRTTSKVTILPTYRSYRPNGDGCEPVCTVAKYSWVVKNPW